MLCRYFHFNGDHLSFIYYGYRRKSMLTLQFTERREFRRNKKRIGIIIIIILLILALYWRHTRFRSCGVIRICKPLKPMFTSFLGIFLQFGAKKICSCRMKCNSVVSRRCWTPSVVTFHSLTLRGAAALERIRTIHYIYIIPPSTWLIFVFTLHFAKASNTRHQISNYSNSLVHTRKTLALNEKVESRL